LKHFGFLFDVSADIQDKCQRINIIAGVVSLSCEAPLPANKVKVTTSDKVASNPLYLKQ
jgi:hypothetical protein